MKLTTPASLLVLGLSLAVACTGCKSGPKGKTGTEQGAKTGETPGPGAGGTIPGPGVTGENPTGTPTYGIPQSNLHAGWPEHPDILKADTVHFAYDSSTVEASEKSKVSAVADYLKANTENAVKIAGHCDERGTEEYNRSLGERRALALREELVHLGIEATRVDTVTFGKDRPVATGHDEAAWKQNRRGEFIVLTPPK